MSTLCIVAHPDSNGSSSQQYLLQAGEQGASVNYLNLAKDAKAFDIQYIKKCLVDVTQIIFQFPLYWYQAPSILKVWLDEIWSQFSANELKNKYLGIVVVVGSKREHYQVGGKVGRTLSELLSSYEVLAKHFRMNFKPVFPIYQFQFMTDEQLVKWSLFMEQLQNQAEEIDEIMTLMRNEG